MKRRGQIPKKVEDALRRLEDAVYSELSRAVEGRGSAESIARLTAFLRDVQHLRASSVQADKWSTENSSEQPELPLPQASEVPEFSLSGDLLVRRGKRQDGAGHYEQRIPWDTVRRLAETIDVNYGGRSFHPPTLAREVDVPAYQVYAALKLFSLFRQVESPRRGTYKRSRGATVLGGLESMKTSLPPTGALEGDAIGGGRSEEEALH